MTGSATGSRLSATGSLVAGGRHWRSSDFKLTPLPAFEASLLLTAVPSDHRQLSMPDTHWQIRVSTFRLELETPQAAHSELKLNEVSSSNLGVFNEKTRMPVRQSMENVDAVDHLPAAKHWGQRAV